MAELNPRQLRFVQLYVRLSNATEAARQAGYQGDDNALHVTGARLLRKATIAKMIDEAQRDVQALYAAENYANFLRELRMADTAESEAVRLQAIKDMLDRGGLKPVEKHEHAGSMEVEHGIDFVSANALLAVLGYGAVGSTDPGDPTPGPAGDPAPPTD
jgi:phage terminase small subunit